MRIRHTLVIPIAAFVTLSLGACSRGTSPTETSAAKAATMSGASSVTAVATSVAADADKRGGNGHGDGGHGNGGNGNGGGHGHGPGGGPGTGTATLQIQPDAWNLETAHAQGTISALVRGIDVTKLDASTVQLVVAGGTPISPLRVQTAGGQLRAFFAMSDVIGALAATTKPGDQVTVTLDATVGGTALTLTDTVRIVGEGGGGGGGHDDHVTAAIHPDSWCDRTGTVTVMLHGAVADVDLTSIRLVGENGTALSPTAAPARTHDGIRASFDEKAAFATLTHAVPGTHHPVEITFDDGTTAKTIDARVNVNNCGGGDDGD